MAYQTIQASPTHTPRGWHIFEEEIHGGQSYDHLEGRGTLYTSGRGENYLMDMEAWIGQEHPHIFGVI